MIFSFDRIIATITTYFSLNIGDLIFTGTPDGVAAIKPNDVLEGFLENNKLFRNIGIRFKVIRNQV